MLLVRNLELSAPGKLILCGEHSVVYGKKALASAIDLRTRVIAHRIESSNDTASFEIRLAQLDRTIRITSNDFNRICSSLELEKSDEDDKIIKAVRLLLAITSGLEWPHISGLRVDVTSEIPLAAGLGSSASFSVCLAALFQVVSRGVHNLSDEDLNAVNEMAFRAETIFHGKPSGIDNSVACFGNYVVLERGSIVDKFALASALELPIVLVNSCVPKQTSEQVVKVRELRDRHSQIVDALMSSINLIVDEFIEALKTATPDSIDSLVGSLNDLITLNHGILHGFQVDNLELATIVGTASKRGFHAKITGSGGGGCCFVLLGRDKSDERRELLVNDLSQAKFVSFPTKLGCKGVTLEKIEFFS